MSVHRAAAPTPRPPSRQGRSINVPEGMRAAPECSRKEDL